MMDFPVDVVKAQLLKSIDRAPMSDLLKVSLLNACRRPRRRRHSRCFRCRCCCYLLLLGVLLSVLLSLRIRSDGTVDEKALPPFDFGWPVAVPPYTLVRHNHNHLSAVERRALSRAFRRYLTSRHEH